MHQLYVSDLDGTLLQSDATLSVKSRDILRGLLDDGMNFTVATARSAFSVRKILGDLPLELPIVCFNGGFISDFHTGEHHLWWGLAPQDARAAFDLCMAAGLPPFVSTTGPDRIYIGTPINAGMRWYLDDRIRAKDHRLFRAEPEEGLAGEVMLLTIVGGPIELAALRDRIQTACDLQMQLYQNKYDPSWWWLTVHPPRVSKASALDTLRANWPAAQTVDGSPRRMVVFGDAENDLEMFESADHAVAPANAASSVKSLANEVIEHADEDSVALWLSRHLRNR